MLKMMKRTVVFALVLLLPGMILSASVGQAAIEPGVGMFSYVNLDYENGNTFYIDEFTLYDLDANSVAFSYNFAGRDGDPWHPGAFGRDLFVYPKNPAAVRYFIEDNTGIMEVDPRREGTASTYGKVTPLMKDLHASELFMRFRVDDASLNQYLRVWIQSDNFSSGSSFAANGFGIALHFGRQELTLQQRIASSTKRLDQVEVEVTDEWYNLKMHAADGTVAVKLWNDKDEEPADWTIGHAL